MPGGNGLLVNAHLGVLHLTPLRKSFVPSLRHNLHFDPKYLPIFFSPFYPAI
jgi:hypothetical protein